MSFRQSDVWTQQAANGKTIDKRIKAKRENRTLRHLRCSPTLRQTVKQNIKLNTQNGNSVTLSSQYLKLTYLPESIGKVPCQNVMCSYTHTFCSVSKALEKIFTLLKNYYRAQLCNPVSKLFHIFNLIGDLLVWHIRASHRAGKDLFYEEIHKRNEPNEWGDHMMWAWLKRKDWLDLWNCLWVQCVIPKYI